MDDEGGDALGDNVLIDETAEASGEKASSRHAHSEGKRQKKAKGAKRDVPPPAAEKEESDVRLDILVVSCIISAAVS